MATKAIIRCKRCEEEFPIYWSDMSHDLLIRCKNCSATMDEFMSEQVFNAFATVVDANHELYKSHLENHMPLFEVDFSHTTYYVDDED